MPSYMPDVWIISLVIRLLPWRVGEEEVWRECWFASITASILIHLFFSLECVKESHQGLLLSSVFLSAFPDGPGLENIFEVL